MTSGYETSQPPPPSRSPSPLTRPSRLAAVKAKKAVTEAIAVDMASKWEVEHSVATALAGVFAISVNKICKIMEIFE